jgi:hypothetical protein
MKAIAPRTPVPAAAVMAIEAGCDGVAHLQRRSRYAGRGARSARPRRRGRSAAAVARRGRAEAPAAGQRALPCRRVARPAARGACLPIALGATSIAPSPTRWPAFCDAQAAGARPGRSPCVVARRQPPSTATSSTAGSRRFARSGFEPVYDDTVFARQRYVCRCRAELRAAAIRALARSVDCWPDRRSRRLRQRASPAAARS